MTSAAFLAIAFLTGIAGALQLPTLSVFLSQEVEARPFMVGLFYTGSAVIGILVSQFLAAHSDKHGDRKILIFNCCLLGALGCVLFAYDRNYYLLLGLCVLLISFGSTANPQLFALAREHADNTGREAVIFSSVLRAQVSLAWVIGPPLAFALVMGFDFKTMYLMAGVTFLLCCALVWLMLPSMRKTQRQAREVLEAPRRNRQDTLRLFGACTLMWTCNCMYLINMPLYILHELHLPEKTAGVMMGTAAGLEIPTMLLAGWLSRRWGETAFDAPGGGGRGAVLPGHANNARSYGATDAAVTECSLYRYPGRHRHDLFSGFDARSGRCRRHLVYQQRAGVLDYRRIAGGSGIGNRTISQRLFAVADDDCRCQILHVAHS